MKRPLLYGPISAAAVLVLLVSLPVLVPLSAYRGRIEAAVERATGHSLKIEVPVRLRNFPMLGVQADKVSSDGAGASSPDLARWRFAKEEPDAEAQRRRYAEKRIWNSLSKS